MKRMHWPEETPAEKKLARWGVAYFWAIVLLSIATMLT